jgi:DNA polymerase I
MAATNYKNFLDKIKEENELPTLKRYDRVLLIDGLNLFFRNFAVLNMVNPEGAHTGGLGGFLRSLGALIKNLRPTSVFVIFDGAGSSMSRKNLIPEYKSGRNITRITNWDIFDNVEDEGDAKITQIIRIIQYLKLLPVKIMVVDKVEADDVIAVLSKTFPKKFNSKVFIVSTDKDFIQLVNDDVIVYRPIEKDFYNNDLVLKKFGVLTENFIIYKTLLGDNSDKVQGIKGMGEGKLKKLFPELSQRVVPMEEIFEISALKYKEHIIYSRIVHERVRIEETYKIMDLSRPLIGDEEKEYLKDVIREELPDLNISTFMEMYEKDQLGGIIRNLENWLKDNFIPLKNYK